MRGLVPAGKPSCAPDETPDGTPECLSGVGPGLPLQMHAFGPGGLHDHPPTTLFQSAGGHAVLGGG